jgi:hypothetical protein
MLTKEKKELIWLLYDTLLLTSGLDEPATIARQIYRLIKLVLSC